MSTFMAWIAVQRKRGLAVLNGTAKCLRIAGGLLVLGPRWAWLQANEWAWFSGLFLGGFAVAGMNEFWLAAVLFALAALAATAQLWKSKLGNYQTITKIVLTLVIIFGVVYLLAILNVYRGDRPWSQFPTAIQEAAKFLRDKQQATSHPKKQLGGPVQPQPPTPTPSQPMPAPTNLPKSNSSPKPHNPSFAFIFPGAFLPPDHWDFIVGHRGPNPNFNVNFFFVDEVKKKLVLADRQSLTVDDINSYQRTFSFPEIDPKGRGTIFARQVLWPPPVLDHQSYDITVTSREGTVQEAMKVERVDGKWFYDVKIYDVETNRVLMDCQDPGFPMPRTAQRCFPEIVRTE